MLPFVARPAAKQNPFVSDASLRVFEPSLKDVAARGVGLGSNLGSRGHTMVRSLLNASESNSNAKGDGSANNSSGRGAGSAAAGASGKATAAARPPLAGAAGGTAASGAQQEQGQLPAAAAGTAGPRPVSVMELSDDDDDLCRYFQPH